MENLHFIFIVLLAIQLAVLYYNTLELKSLIKCVPLIEDIQVTIVHVQFKGEENNLYSKDIHFIKDKSGANTNFKELERINNHIYQKQGLVYDSSFISDTLKNKAKELSIKAENLPAIQSISTFITVLLLLTVSILSNNTTGSASFYLSITLSFALFVVGLLFLTLLKQRLIPVCQRKIIASTDNLISHLSSIVVLPSRPENSFDLEMHYRSINLFNTQFSENLRSFSNIIRSSESSLKMHNEILGKLESIDIQEVAVSHGLLLERVEKLIPHFIQLEEFMGKVNHSIDFSEKLTTNLIELVDHTQDTKDIMQYVKEATSTSDKLLSFMEKHYTEIDSRAQAFALATGTMEDSMKKTVGYFKTYVEDKISNLRQLAITEEEYYSQAFESNKRSLDHLNELPEILELLKSVASRPVITVTEEVDRLIGVIAKQEEPKKSNLQRLNKFIFGETPDVRNKHNK